MGLESGNYIADLNAANPPGTDPKSQGDDHLRLIKNVLKNSLAGFSGAVLVTGVDGGAVNAYTLTPSTPLLAYAARMIAIISPTIANTGASTINVSGLGAKSLLSVSGAALAANELLPGNIYLAIYDGTAFRLSAVTKQYIDNLVLSGALPTAPNNGLLYYLQSLNGSYFWGLSTVPDYLLQAQGVI